MYIYQAAAGIHLRLIYPELFTVQYFS